MEYKTFSFQFLRTFEELCLHANYNTINLMMVSALKNKIKSEVKIKTYFEKEIFLK